jgi:hypothetical protein
MADSTQLGKEFKDTMNWMESFLSSTDPALSSSQGGRGSIAPSPLTQTESTSETQYRISDPAASDDESDGEDCFDPNATEIHGQEIPDWALIPNLLPQLQHQQGVDPDLIFTNFDKTCDLMQMFEKKKRTFKIRGDSGWWAKDGLTPAEEALYKKALGLA